MRIELRPLPGLASEDTRRLSRQAFEVKSVERSSPGDAASYVLRLRQPIPLGRKVFVRFALRLGITGGRQRIQQFAGNQRRRPARRRTDAQHRRV